MHLQEEAAVWAVHGLRAVVQERSASRLLKVFRGLGAADVRARLQRVKEDLLPSVQVGAQDHGSLVAPILDESAQELRLHSTLST